MKKVVILKQSIQTATGKITNYQSWEINQNKIMCGVRVLRYLSWICTGVTKSSFLQQTGSDHGCRGTLGGPVWSWRQGRLVSGHAGCLGVSSQGWMSRFHSLGKSWRASCGLCFQGCSSSCNSSKINKERKLFPRIPKGTHRMDPAGDAWQRNRI